MKNNFVESLTKNWGLKILSVGVAIILWLVVVNVDDPIISKTYTGIPVEVMNEQILTDEDRTYEVIDGTDTITVVVSAKRSVINQMSKDYLRATADLKYLTPGATVPIELRSTRLSDKIESITSRTENMKLMIEDIVKVNVSINVMVTGEPDDGYILRDATPSVRYVKVSGPESLVDMIDSAYAYVDISDIQKSVSTNVPILIMDKDGNEVTDSRLELSHSNVNVEVRLFAVKEVPISSGYSGEPAKGYIATGMVVTNPESVEVAGSGENFEDLDVIYIDPEKVSIEGATADVSTVINISECLPSDVTFADKSFDGNVIVGISVEQKQRKTIEIPISNIVVENVPEGYMTNIVCGEPTIKVEVEGLGDAFDRFDGTLAIGRIDATKMAPRSPAISVDNNSLTLGENDGTIVFDLPQGITETGTTTMLVIVNHVGDVTGETVPVINEANEGTSVEQLVPTDEISTEHTE